jgi:PAS domain S-box-containing protein
MSKKVKCWEVFKCNKTECSVYKSKEPACWLISGTHCRDQIQGKFLEKMEMCLDCVVFRANMDVSAMRETIEVVDKQFKEFRAIVKGRDKELENISMELALGLSEVLEALNKIASGDPRVIIPESSENELISKLKQIINKTAKEIGAIVDQSHEFAIGLAEHFDILNRVSKGELTARISESSRDELLIALGKVTNHMIESVSTEINERKKAEEELREKEERENLILRSLPMAFYNVQFSGGTSRFWVSEQIDCISGFPVSKFVEDQTFWVSRIHPEFRNQVIKKYGTIYKEGSVAIEYLWQCADGSYRWFSNQAVFLRDEQGDPREIIGTWRDISERKKAEEEIHKLNEELEQRVIERTSQLEAANRELESFSYSVSHDLRAPLRHVIGFVNLLEKEKRSTLDEEGIEYLDIISQSAKRMGNLIDDLLTFSRMGRFEIKKTEVNTEQLVKEVIGELQEEMEGRDIFWKIGELPEVYGDRSMLSLVFTNLISNALKYTRTRAKTEIELGCMQETDTDVFFVRDNGVGFNMKYVDKLFGVFQRLHREEEFEGTGIGLANVQRIVHRHGGKSWAEGSVDEGATFYFSLPKNRRMIYECIEEHFIG